VDIPGLTYTFTTGTNAKVLVIYNVYAYAIACAFCGYSTVYFDVVLNNTFSARFNNSLPNSESSTFSNSHLITVGPGTHTVKITGTTAGPTNVSCDASTSGSGGILKSNLIVQVIPE
jgi:predicted nucleic-acid-binding Zn-ribbon protein